MFASILTTSILNFLSKHIFSFVTTENGVICLLFTILLLRCIQNVCDLRLTKVPLFPNVAKSVNDFHERHLISFVFHELILHWFLSIGKHRKRCNDRTVYVKFWFGISLCCAAFMVFPQTGFWGCRRKNRNDPKR